MYRSLLQSFGGNIKLVATEVLGSPEGIPFAALRKCTSLNKDSGNQCCVWRGREVMAHAVEISSGGPPISFIAAEKAFTF